MTHLNSNPLVKAEVYHLGSFLNIKKSTVYKSRYSVGPLVFRGWQRVNTNMCKSSHLWCKCLGWTPMHIPTNDKSDGQLSDNKRAVGAHTPLISCQIFVVWFRGSTPYPHARIIEIWSRTSLINVIRNRWIKVSWRPRKLTRAYPNTGIHPTWLHRLHHIYINLTLFESVFFGRPEDKIE